jgi:hypothetical protein
VVHPDDELHGFPGHKRDPSATTLRVAELLRMPGTSERWRQRCEQSLMERFGRSYEFRVWQFDRQDPYALCRLADDGCPQLEPQELGGGPEPYDGGALPFSSSHTLSLADCYFVLILVHNAERRSGRFNPFQTTDARAEIYYFAQLSTISQLSANDRVTLGDCLARVEADMALNTAHHRAPNELPQRPANAHATETEGPSPAKKASTERGEARSKIIAALTEHHRYADGSSLNQQPIGVNELSANHSVSKSSVSRFFKKEFGSHSKYRNVYCTDTRRLVAGLKKLNGEYTVDRLFGDTVPGEGKNDGDDL